MTGIYKIQSKAKPERIYIGSAVNVPNRWKGHIRDLGNGKHHSKKLQRHFDKYGERDLCFSLITSCAKSDLLSIEQFYIDAFAPYFNECPVAGSRLGKKCSDETRKKISECQIGRVPWNKGKKLSDEYRKKLSDAHKGQVAWNKGLTKEDERVMKYALTQTGRKFSKERRQHISDAHKGQEP